MKNFQDAIYKTEKLVSQNIGNFYFLALYIAC